MSLLRPATPDDAAAIDTLLAASYPRLLAEDYARDVLAAALPRMVRAQPALLASGTFYLLFSTDGALVAAGGWTRQAPGRTGTVQPGVGNIRHVAAHPDHLRQGHARPLMQHIIQDARRCGVTRLDCLSTLTAVPFYASLGFDRLANLDVAMGPDITFPSVRMVRAV
ncbi:GNAT family N-acetyltransferase [Jannaschia sp. 2305UL9-9]|uniref:GNAT family N-acetyltransferase n=1 Tax=Jannaschia sp. 2305UL9-9 TaxID=3121638 RepID=UPI0035285DDA